MNSIIEIEGSIREANLLNNYRGSDIRNLFTIDYKSTIKIPGSSHIRLRMIRTGRIRKVLKAINK
jgi:hypothetical protein